MAGPFSSMNMVDTIMQTIAAQEIASATWQNLTTQLLTTDNSAELDGNVRLIAHDLDIARSNIFLNRRNILSARATGVSQLAALDLRITNTNTNDVATINDLRRARFWLEKRIELLVEEYEARIELLQVQVQRFVEQMHALRTKKEMLKIENEYWGR